MALGWLKTLRTDASWATLLVRAHRAERKWLASSPITREALGEQTIAQLVKILKELDVDDTEVFSDPMDRLLAQVSVGLVACRVAVGLDKSADAVVLAKQVRRQFELMLELADQERLDVEDPKAWRSLVETGQLVREQYTLTVGSW